MASLVLLPVWLRVKELYAELSAELYAELYAGAYAFEALLLNSSGGAACTSTFATWFATIPRTRERLRR